MKNNKLFLKRVAAFGIDLAVFYVPARIAGFNHGELITAWVLYESALISYWNGSTVGKRRMGLKVTTAAKKPVLFSKALLRTVFKLVSTLIFFLGDLWMLRDKKSKTWHDQWAGTIVVQNAK